MVRDTDEGVRLGRRGKFDVKGASNSDKMSQ